jgi:hypothetical protein
VKRQIISLQRQAGKAKRYQDAASPNCARSTCSPPANACRCMDEDIRTLESRLSSIT